MSLEISIKYNYVLKALIIISSIIFKSIDHCFVVAEAFFLYFVVFVLLSLENVDCRLDGCKHHVWYLR